MDMRRRLLALAGLGGWTAAAGAQTPGLVAAVARAHALRDEAVRSGDQPYGAVVIDAEGRIVGEAPSRVVVVGNVDAHAEREALRDALRKLGRNDLGGMMLVSSSRPCALCEAAAAKAGIARMFHGTGTDAGAPRSR